MSGVLQRRGFNSRIVYVFNPCPTEVSDKDILDRAKLSLTREASVNPFRFEWTFGSGGEKETIQIEPGQFFPVREPDVKEMMPQLAQLGAVVVNEPQDEDEVGKARVRGLRAAYEFWNSRGRPRLNDFMRANRISAEQLDQERELYWPYFYNEAKAAVLKSELEAALKQAK